MSIIRGPFVKFKCGTCCRWVERNISARRAAQELSDLCDGPQLYCALCDVEQKAQTPQGRWESDKVYVHDPACSITMGGQCNCGPEQKEPEKAD